MFARYIDAQFAERTFRTEERDGETIVFFQARPAGPTRGLRWRSMGSRHAGPWAGRLPGSGRHDEAVTEDSHAFAVRCAEGLRCLVGL